MDSYSTPNHVLGSGSCFGTEINKIRLDPEHLVTDECDKHIQEKRQRNAGRLALQLIFGEGGKKEGSVLYDRLWG